MACPSLKISVRLPYGRVQQVALQKGAICAQHITTPSHWVDGAGACPTQQAPSGHVDTLLLFFGDARNCYG